MNSMIQSIIPGFLVALYFIREMLWTADASQIVDEREGWGCVKCECVKSRTKWISQNRNELSTDCVCYNSIISLQIFIEDLNIK